MSAGYKQWTDFLIGLGIEQVAHTQKNYLAHLINVYRLMESHGLDDVLCRAGLFHSIYGTEKFQGFKLEVSERERLATMIGDRAERLAYWNCFMDRASLDAQLTDTSDTYHIVHRETGERMPLTRAEYDDLCCVHLFDWLEQAPRSRFGWGYRREAYRGMARRLGPFAERAYEAVFSQEPTTQSP